MNFDIPTLRRLRGFTHPQRRRLVDSLGLDNDAFVHEISFNAWRDLLVDQLGAFEMTYSMPEFNVRLDSMLGIKRCSLPIAVSSPIPGRKIDWFVCHNSRDKETLLNRVVPALKAESITCEFDITLLHPGWSWLDQVETAISDMCRGVIVLMGENGWGPVQRKEFQVCFGSYGSAGQGPLVPVVIPPFKRENLRGFLSTLHALSLEDDAWCKKLIMT